MTASGAPNRRARRSPRRGRGRSRLSNPSGSISARMPSSTRGSLSIASTFRPESGSPSRSRTGPSRRAASGAAVPRGAVTAKTEPSPSLERSPPDGRAHAPAARRSTGQAPGPVRSARPDRAAGTPQTPPAAAPAGCRARCPRPRCAPHCRTRRQPTSTRPRSVYFSALETRFWSRRRIRRRSVRTASLVVTKRVRALWPGRAARTRPQACASDRRPARRRFPA